MTPPEKDKTNVERCLEDIRKALEKYNCALVTFPTSERTQNGQTLIIGASFQVVERQRVNG